MGMNNKIRLLLWLCFVMSGPSNALAQESDLEKNIRSLEKKIRAEIEQQNVAVTKTDMEREIMSLDPQTRSQLVQEAIHEMNRGPAAEASAPADVISLGLIKPEDAPPARKEQEDGMRLLPFLPGRGHPSASAGIQQQADAGAAPTRGAREYIKPVGIISSNFVSIVNQRENHILITVGDVVYLDPPLRGKVGKHQRFVIYKYVKEGKWNFSRAATGWFEEVGQLKILESNDKLSIGLVIAARDIIQKGDVVYLGNRL